MFGEWIKEFAKTNLPDGSDCNAWGNCKPDRPMIYYLHKSGFMKVVAERNYRLMKEDIAEKGVCGDIYEPVKKGQQIRNEQKAKRTTHQHKGNNEKTG